MLHRRVCELLVPTRHPGLRSVRSRTYRAARATLRQRQLSAPPSTAKTQIPHYKTTVLILHTATKTNAAVITQPSSLFQTRGSAPTSTLNPHRPTPLPAQTPPAVSSLARLFGRLPSERAALSVTGRRPKTLNISGGTRPAAARQLYLNKRTPSRKRGRASLGNGSSTQSCLGKGTRDRAFDAAIGNSRCDKNSTKPNGPRLRFTTFRLRLRSCTWRACRTGPSVAPGQRSRGADQAPSRPCRRSLCRRCRNWRGLTARMSL